MNFTHAEIIAEIEREIKQRHQVYGRWVAEGKMKQGLKDRRIALMEAARQIVQDATPSLFTDEDVS